MALDRTAALGAAVTWRGEWDAANSYVQNDAITRTGSTYLCTAANIAKPPCWNSSFWVRIGPPLQAATTIYVSASAGNDTTGDGSSGNKYATVARARAQLPPYINNLYSIVVADGTYAEALDWSSFICAGDGAIEIIGNVTTPANVSFTGTVTAVYGQFSLSTPLKVAGPIRLTLQGIRANATASIGCVVIDGAILTLDRCIITGTLTQAVFMGDGRMYLTGNNTFSGFTEFGFNTQYSKIIVKGAGTITVTGPAAGGSTGMGIAHGTVFTVTASAVHFVITGCQVGMNCGLHGVFQHYAASGSITIDNVTTLSDSTAVLCNDHGDWSTNQSLTLDHFTRGFYANSKSYIEYKGSALTQTNIGTLTTEGTDGTVFAT